MLDQEPLRHVGIELRPHGLDAVDDLLLVADQGDPEGGEVLEGDAGHRLHGGDAGLLEVVLVAGHLDAGQPLVHRLELGHVGGVGVQRVLVSGKNAKTFRYTGKEKWRSL